MKLVTIEGHVSEMYGYKDHHSFDFGIFRKKALIRVNTKISLEHRSEKGQVRYRSIIQNNYCIGLSRAKDAIRRSRSKQF